MSYAPVRRRFRNVCWRRRHDTRLLWDPPPGSHLFRYLDGQTFRYNNRNDMNDYDRFELALSRITGKRLAYEHLTGKDREPDTTII